MKIITRSMRLFVTLLVISSTSYINAQEDTTVNDKDIKIIHFEELNYPTLARVAHIEGVVVIRVILDEQGNVAKAVAISGNELLIGDSLANAKKWKFQPNARKMAVIVYSFTLLLADCGPVTSFFMLRSPNLATITSCAYTL